MIKVTNIKAVRLLGVLLILLSGNAFARSMNTLDKAITTETARAKAVEAALKATDTAEAAARDTAIVSAIASEVTNRDTAIAAETTRAKAAEPRVLIPGDSYQGGIVFWVDQTGQHGLIAARADQSSGIRWYNDTYFATNATADGIYAGAKNTEVIISTQTNVGLACSDPSLGVTYPYYCSVTHNSERSIPPAATGDYAALVAAKYKVLDDGVTTCGISNFPVSEICYGDWYLPSSIELYLLFMASNLDLGLHPSPRPTFNGYWTSTQSSEFTSAKIVSRDAPTTGMTLPKHYLQAVRAIRKF